jgi:multidrug efflux pump subunit AcrA (membrane-fusion protein)
MKKNVLFTVIGSAVCLLLFSTGCKKPVAAAPEKALVRAASVESMDNLRSEGEATYLAMVRADNETDLSFKVGGIVDCIGPAEGKDWDEGTPVKAGTILCELKQADFTNALNSARAHADLAAKVLERFQKLRSTDVISQQEFDVAEANFRAAKAQMEQAEQNLRDSRLVAPIDGVVLARYANSRVIAGPGQKMLRFADTSLMSVELGLPDRLVSRLTPGTEVDVMVTALEGIKKTEDYFVALGMPVSLTQLGIGPVSDDRLDEMAQKCCLYGKRLVGAERPLETKDINAIYKMANN